jgi:hypothetical protein
VEGGIGVLLSEGREYPATPSGFYTVRIQHADSGIDEIRGVEIADDTTGSRLAVAIP